MVAVIRSSRVSVANLTANESGKQEARKKFGIIGKVSASYCFGSHRSRSGRSIYVFSCFPDSYFLASEFRFRIARSQCRVARATKEWRVFCSLGRADPGQKI